MRIGKIIWIGILILCIGTQMIYAEERITKETVDWNQKGSVTIYKYETDSDTPEDNDGAHPTYKPLSDVTYTLYQIADITQNHLENGGGSVTIEYTSRLISETGSVIDIPSRLSGAQELHQFVTELRESSDPAKRISQSCLASLPSWKGRTDADGYLRFGKDAEGNNLLPLGIYMLYEEEYPSIVTDTQAAVFSLPMTDSLEGEGENWIYDVVLHPKNRIQMLSIEKHIIADRGEATEAQNTENDDPSNDVLTDTEDYEMGDTISYLIRSEVPPNVGMMEFYYITERMGAGLTFTNDVAGENVRAAMEVWGRNALNGTMEFIPQKDGEGICNYIVTDPSDAADESQAFADTYGNSQTITEDKCRTFHIYFNTQALSQEVQDSVKRTRRYSEIYITYNAVLNENAIIGNPGNPNDAALMYSHTTESSAKSIENTVHIPPEDSAIDTVNPRCADTKVFTYALEISKVGEGADNMSGTEFRLYNAKREEIKVTAFQDGRGYYIDNEKEEASDVIRITEENIVNIYGLDDGLYQLVETKAVRGYNLLVDPIVITIVSEAASEAVKFQYQEDPEGEYIQIEDGYGYFIEQEHPTTGRVQKLSVDLTGHTVGDYVAIAQGKEVKCYILDGDDGTMSNEESTVVRRYRYRWTEDKNMIWKSNYNTKENGIFNLRVYNRKGLEVPATGGEGSMVFIVSGGLVFLCGVWGLIRRFGKRSVK